RGSLDRDRVGRATGRLAALTSGAAPSGAPSPPIVKMAVTVDPPTTGDNASDLTRTLRALKRLPGHGSVTVDFHATRLLPDALRDGTWTVTATLLHEDPREPGNEGTSRVIRFEPGDTASRHYAVAIDVGTTTLCGELIDLGTGDIAAAASDYNGQNGYGDDVITRMVYARKPEGRESLRKAVIGTINGIIDELTATSGADRSDISLVTVAGNTVMIHLLLGLDTRHLRAAPYTQVLSQTPFLGAAELGINLGEHALLRALPMVASYVGGDITAGGLATGLHRRDTNSLFIDIGTNGEIVLGNAEWLVTASCSAGPAFEGGGIRHGMRATFGAIEEIRIDPETCEAVVFTIVNVKPKGICGSGIITIVAELLECGILEPNGRFSQGLPPSRLREGRDGMEFILVGAEQSGIDGEIVITEADIDNFMRAKGALYAGYMTLLESVGLDRNDLDEIIIAGAFGGYIDIEKSIIVGLFPDLPLDRFSFIGNGSLAGARLCALSGTMLDEVEGIAARMTNFELSENRSFMDHYVASLFFPHTEMRNFPTVMERFRNTGRPCHETTRGKGKNGGGAV
ncbi:MAG: DUF4445 domain-containing protein, partial [Chrysiogenales bacterium]